MYDVFVSHASDDKQVADLVVGALEKQGIRCWIAPRDVIVGGTYAESIVKAIRSCPVFLLIYSAQANASSHVFREVERAGNVGAAIIPFRIEDIVPTESMEYFISSQHWLNAYEPPVEQHIAKLVEVVTQKLNGGQSRATESRGKPASSFARNLIARFAFGRHGCAFTVTLFGLFVVVSSSMIFRQFQMVSAPPPDIAYFPPDITDSPPDTAYFPPETAYVPPDMNGEGRQMKEALMTIKHKAADRAERFDRWRVILDGNPPELYLHQLDKLGAEVAFPISPGRWVYFSDLQSLQPHAEIRDLTDESRIYFEEDGEFGGVARILGVDDAPFMILFLPRALEEKMASLEREYQGAEEEDIVRTSFRAVEVDGRMEMIVADQQVR